MENRHSLNVLGEPLTPCSFEPLTGFLRDGCCKTNTEDAGSHLICAIVTKEFLQFSLQKGNDLITPRPDYQFPGLTPGDQWCLCVNRWIEALHAGCAPYIKLESTHIKTLETIPLNILKEYASEVWKPTTPIILYCHSLPDTASQWRNTPYCVIW